MKLPRSVNAAQIVTALRRIGYGVTRQTGSHIRLTLSEPPEHHVTVPNHDPIQAGTLSSIIGDVAKRFNITREEAVRRLFK
ncbi:MAG: type II toxin-antitoxin system HicA family toxin [Nitrospinae bacterium]|nr:type II toxin-antitoxin system HicA family toxin [Nitrospinota bacterium]